MVISKSIHKSITDVLRKIFCEMMRVTFLGHSSTCRHFLFTRALISLWYLNRSYAGFCQRKWSDRNRRLYWHFVKLIKNECDYIMEKTAYWPRQKLWFFLYLPYFGCLMLLFKLIAAWYSWLLIFNSVFEYLRLFMLIMKSDIILHHFKYQL